MKSSDFIPAILGIAAAPFTAGASLPLTAALVGGGAALSSSLIGADASQTAAAQEIAGANKALDVQKQIYQQQQQNLAPYQQLGASSLGNLQSLANQPVVSQNPGGWGYTARSPQQPTSLGSIGAGSPSSSGWNSGMVMLEAPTGERQSVPANQVQGLVQKGAKVIG